jgi:hypothetical protein
VIAARILFSFVAGLAVWALWRRTAQDAVTAWIVGIGLVARALGGCVLFWISYLHLPFGQSLQLGRGFWFFAPDAVNYFDYASQAAADGLYAILTVNPSLPSRFYIQSLAAFIYVLGASPAVGILLNALAYLVTCWLVVAWTRRAGVGKLPMLVALSAISFCPSWILWSFQPLKDTLFLALMVAYAFVASEWLDSDTDAKILKRTALAVFLLSGLLYAVAAIRWYVAVLMTGASALAWLYPLVTFNRRRLARVMGVAAFLLLAAVVIPLSAGPYLPVFGQMLFRPQSPGELARVASAATEYVVEKREDSLATSASTLILAGDGTTGTTFPRAVAMFVPRAVGTRLGLVHIDGGRGLWVMAELDTLFLDLTLVAIGWVLWQQHRRGFRVRPVFVLVAMTTAVLIAVLCYQTANFGTQFRLRSMVAVGFMLLPYSMGPSRKAPEHADVRVA